MMSWSVKQACRQEIEDIIRGTVADHFTEIYIAAIITRAHEILEQYGKEERVEGLTEAQDILRHRVETARR